MVRDDALYEKMETPIYDLPILFHRDHLSRDGVHRSFQRHWHEKIEFLYFIKGEAVIQCNSEWIHAKTGDLVVINSNELHEGHTVSDESEYYCLIVDTSLFLTRNIDVCEEKYFKPIYQNYILFENKVENDRAVRSCFRRIVKEFETKDTGFEIAVKSSIYQLLVILLRNHAKCVLTQREYDRRLKKLKRFNRVMEFIEQNYQEDISAEELCTMAHLSRFRFCHLFKEMTGRTLSEHINIVRTNKAEELLLETDMNISEVAASCGYNDANYFSRVFRKYKKVPPSELIRHRL